MWFWWILALEISVRGGCRLGSGLPPSTAENNLSPEVCVVRFEATNQDYEYRIFLFYFLCRHRITRLGALPLQHRYRKGLAHAQHASGPEGAP